MTYIKKTSYFEVAPPGHTIVHKNINDILKNALIYPNMFYGLKLWRL